jgi:hypothetical protein
MKRFFARKPAQKKPIIVVSGLPRSGTSMMMKMLEVGGLELVTDELRGADEDNPQGYFEFEEVKQLPAGNAAWLSGAQGKAVKIVSALLEHLPSEFSYKVIFMEREIGETLASQQKMLERRSEVSRQDDLEMENQFRRHLAAVKPWLARQPNIDVLYVSYNRLMQEDAAQLCRGVAEFIGVPLDTGRMSAVPSGDLYRNRKIPE